MVKTAKDIPVNVSVTVVVQVMQDMMHFYKAIEHFLGKTKEEIGQIITTEVDAHLRLVYEAETLEEILRGTRDGTDVLISCNNNHKSLLFFGRCPISLWVEFLCWFIFSGVV